MPSKRRYDRVKEQLDNMPIDKLKMCPNKGGCACTGCVNTLDVRSSELKWYKDNHVKDNQDERSKENS
jgi:hypothetical protein